jgi:hypothetical protein
MVLIGPIFFIVIYFFLINGLRETTTLNVTGLYLNWPVLGNGIKIISVFALGRVETVADKPNIYIFIYKDYDVNCSKGTFLPFRGPRNRKISVRIYMSKQKWTRTNWFADCCDFQQIAFFLSVRYENPPKDCEFVVDAHCMIDVCLYIFLFCDCN